MKNKDNYVFVYKNVSLPDYPPSSLFGEYATWHPVSGINQVYAELKSGLKHNKINETTKFAKKEHLSNMVENIKKHADKKQDFNSRKKMNTAVPKKCEPKLSKKRRVQAGSFKNELEECMYCQRKFADLSKHLKNGDCQNSFENIKNGQKIDDTIDVGSEKACMGESESVVCKGCSKQFKRLQVHLRSKTGSKC